MVGDEPARSQLSALRRHQRRLLYGGGGLLTLLIVLTAIASAFIDVADYRAQQRQVLIDGRAAFDTFFIQRERGVMRSLLGNDVLWAQRRDHLVRNGAPLEQAFTAANEALVVRASELAVPWLTLGQGTVAMPKDRLAAYLGMIYESSSHTQTTVAEVESPGTLAAYGYDDTGSLFALTGFRNETDLLGALKVRTRSEAFARLMLSPEQLKPTATGSNSFDSARKGLLVSSFAHNPFNGAPSLMGVMTQRTGGQLYYRIVFFDAVAKLKNDLLAEHPGSFMVVTRAGDLVLESGTPQGDTASRMAMLHDAGLWRTWPTGVAVGGTHGSFFVADQLKGIDWAIVHVYTWQEILQRLGPRLALLAAITLLILALQWTVLLRMDRRIFTPALASASRVYESEQLSQAIIGTSPVALCLLDPNTAGAILHNDAMQELAGRIVDDPVTLYTQLLEAALRQADDTREFPLTIHLAGEHARILTVAMARTLHRDRPAYLFALRDVTAQAELEESLRQARADSEAARLDAESASRAKSSFVATMSHEIRTPLNGILGHLELLGRSRLDTMQREHWRRIGQSAESLLGIVSDILDFSRIEAGQLEVDPQPFALRPLIEQVTALFSPAAQGKGIDLSFAIDPALAPGYVADVARIRQVLNNLVGNAVKFTASGRVILRADAVGEDASTLRFEVIDSGIGMSAQQLVHVFDPFSQADASISRRFGGSGLGLALCRQIATLLGGRIVAESTLGVGSVFRFDLPVTLDRDGLATSAQPGMLLTNAGEVAGKPAVQERGRVLLVDDHPVNRELIQQQLETLGFAVDSAQDGEDALRQWREDTYVAVLTDINMPRMNGYDLTAALRATGARLPILGATATVLAGEKQRYRDVGMTELLLKPLLLDRLDAALSLHTGVASAPPPSLRTGRLPEKVRRIFVEAGTRDLDNLLDPVRRDDATATLQGLHAIKGVLLMIGEHEAAGQCGALEQSIENAGIATCGAMLDAFATRFREILDRHTDAGLPP